MTTSPDASERAGWEMVFRTGEFPPKYQTHAAPNQSVVEWADTLPTGASILDVGCGVGRHVIYLGGRGFQMAGMDVSPSGVKISQEVCLQSHIPFDGRVAEMASLPWEDAVFDAALSTSTICHSVRADIARALDEVWRVLKPGGLFLVDFLHKDTLSYQRTREQAARGELTEIEPDTFVDQSPTPDLMDDAFLPHHYSDETDVRDLLKRFEILKVWPDLSEPAPNSTLARRGYWVASVRKPAHG